MIYGDRAGCRWSRRVAMGISAVSAVMLTLRLTSILLSSLPAASGGHLTPRVGIIPEWLVTPAQPTGTLTTPGNQQAEGSNPVPSQTYEVTLRGQAGPQPARSATTARSPSAPVPQPCGPNCPIRQPSSDSSSGSTACDLSRSSYSSWHRRRPYNHLRGTVMIPICATCPGGRPGLAPRIACPTAIPWQG